MRSKIAEERVVMIAANLEVIARTEVGLNFYFYFFVPCVLTINSRY